MAGNEFIWRFTPSRTEPDLLEEIFVQRQGLLADLVERVRESALTGTKHQVLLIGPRGIGKTHLIALLHHRITQDPELAERVRIAWFLEDETITSFVQLLKRTYELLAEEYPAEFPREWLDDLLDQPPARILKALEKNLIATFRDKTLLLFIENLDLIFEGLGDEGQKQWRAFLQTHPFTSIVATSQRLFNSVRSRDKAFFGFFAPTHLQPLPGLDAVDLLGRIARHREQADLVEFLATPEGRSRVRALHHLAGGNHRIYIVLSGFITRESLDELAGPFEKMADELTPYYQERMLWLSAQQRQIVEYLCAREDPCTPKEIARHLLATENTISGQLKKLLELGYVLRNPRGRESLYELAEPLMRLVSEVKERRRKPLRLLVTFLRIWYRPDVLPKLLERASTPSLRTHLQAAISQSLGSPNITIAILDDGVDLAHEDLAQNLWVNPGEVAGNGKDDDGNGWADDTGGWNFVGNNNPVPKAAADFHGTGVASVIGARGNNTHGIAGVAYTSKIMRVKFVEGDSPTTTTSAPGFSAPIYADGGSGDDEIQGGVHNDTLLSGPGADLLDGGRGDDSIDGGDGRDAIYGGPGNDALAGGAGDDQFSLSAGNETIDGGDGLDTLRVAGTDRAETITVSGSAVTIDATGITFAGAAVETFEVRAGKGNDKITVTDAFPGAIHGDDGDDVIAGGPGSDRLYGGAGKDTLTGVGADDTLSGGAGDDTLSGGDGNDVLQGDDGNDANSGDAGGDTARGGAGDDVIGGGPGSDRLFGGDGNDSISGDGDDDLIGGGAGKDTIRGGAGNDLLDGGDGDDDIAGADGNDAAHGGAGGDALRGGPGNDTLDGGPGAGADALKGEAGADRFLLAADSASERSEIKDQEIKAVIDLILRQSEGREQLRRHLAELIAVYRDVGRLSYLGDGLVRTLQRADIEQFGVQKLKEWREAWLELGGGHAELEIPLRIFRVGIEYRIRGDEKVLLDLVTLERTILRQALGLDVEDGEESWKGRSASS
jgi:Ca2+-binding RTX toxin-like protein/DNA-binding transcriptional ArsR family regulator